jgi:hypothetical protein
MIRFIPGELRELLAGAGADGYRRFFLVGQVVYDDFFDRRHTSRFCVKLRFWQSVEGEPPVFFQVAKGGSQYNYITHEEIPKPDPLTS